MKILTANDHWISFCRGTANGDRHQDKHILSGLATGAKIPVARAKETYFVLRNARNTTKLRTYSEIHFLWTLDSSYAMPISSILTLRKPAQQTINFGNISYFEVASGFWSAKPPSEWQSNVPFPQECCSSVLKEYTLRIRDLEYFALIRFRVSCPKCSNFAGRHRFGAVGVSVGFRGPPRVVVPALPSSWSEIKILIMKLFSEFISCWPWFAGSVWLV